MRKIDMKVNYKKIRIYIGEYTYKCFEYMNDIKQLKNSVRYAVKEELQNKGKGGHLGICSWHFISSHLNNPSFVLKRLNESEFAVERMNLKRERKGAVIYE